MRSTFMGINIAQSALLAQQLAIDTTGQNISNANTPGYTRRRVGLQASTPLAGKDYGLRVGQVGTGVQATVIERLKNQYLDRHFREEQGLKGQYEVGYDYMYRVESIFNETEGQGLSVLLDKFFSAWHEVSINPSSIPLRKILLEAGKNLTEFFNRLISDIQEVQKDIDEDINNYVNDINKKAKRLAELNKQIRISIAQGDNPNDLLDQRDLLIDELSKICNLKIADPINGAFKVIIDGHPIVEGDIYNPLKVVYTPDTLEGESEIYRDLPPLTLNKNSLKINGISIYDDANMANNVIGGANAPSNLVNLINSKAGETGVRARTDESNRLYLYTEGVGTHTITIESDGIGYALTKISNGMYQQTNGYKILTADNKEIIPKKGILNGLYETMYKNIPSLIKQLDTLAASLINNINSIHSNSFDLNKNTGIAFFTGTCASDIKVGKTLIADPTKVSVAADSTYPPGDGSNALKIANLKNSPIINGLSFDKYYTSILTDLGNMVERLGNLNESKKLILEQIDKQKEAISGINIDEEMVNLIKYQRAYTAAARLMNAMDEILDRVVNGLGHVGR